MGREQGYLKEIMNNAENLLQQSEQRRMQADKYKEMETEEAGWQTKDKVEMELEEAG